MPGQCLFETAPERPRKSALSGKLLSTVFEMAKPLGRTEILENLKMLADWIRVKQPGEHFELVVVGGAAMTIEGFKDQTMDIDVIRPEVLPEPILRLPTANTLPTSSDCAPMPRKLLKRSVLY